jgi:hypothetical protein
VFHCCKSIFNPLSFLQIDVIYRGLLLKDDKTLESYGLKDNATVYIIYKEPKVEGNITLGTQGKVTWPLPPNKSTHPGY